MSRTLQLYRPSNGCDGEWFEAQFCERCEHEREWREKQENPCDIHTRALFFGVDDEGYPNEWRYDAAENPVCTKFKDVDDRGGEDRPRPKPNDPLQLVLVADPTEDIALAPSTITIPELLSVSLLNDRGEP